MKTAKTIEELYKEAKEFDVVITVDAALATALNARVDEPRLNGERGGGHEGGFHPGMPRHVRP